MKKILLLLSVLIFTVFMISCNETPLEPRTKVLANGFTVNGNIRNAVAWNDNEIKWVLTQARDKETIIGLAIMAVDETFKNGREGKRISFYLPDQDVFGFPYASVIWCSSNKGICYDDYLIDEKGNKFMYAHFGQKNE